MNDKILQLITKIDTIQLNNNINTDIGCKFYFNNIQYVTINNVYYYLDSEDILTITLQPEYIQFCIENNKKYYFEIRYCHINNIILQEDE